MMLPTSNFSFLRIQDADLAQLGALAERYFRDDPGTSIFKLRQFAELLSKTVAARHALYLSEYDGPGAYGRKSRSGRSAEFVYNHINCPPMLLWLAEATGVSRRNVLAARRSALTGRRRCGTHCAVIRRAIPWSVIEERLAAPKR